MNLFLACANLNVLSSLAYCGFFAKIYFLMLLHILLHLKWLNTVQINVREGFVNIPSNMKFLGLPFPKK
jgi:hypothetical protein